MKLLSFQFGPSLGTLMLGVMVSSTAIASEIAVLDFDGYGVAHDEAILVSQGFRDAVLDSGIFFPLEAYDIQDRYMVGFEQDFARARELVGTGRQSLDSGNLSGALRQFEEAKVLHGKAGTFLSRRAEAADVEYFIGRTYLRQGRTAQAIVAMEQTLRLFPGYDTSRATQRNSQIDSAFKKAKSNILSLRKVVLEPDEANMIASRLGVAAVLSGYIDDQGTIYARLIQGSRVVNEKTWMVADWADEKSPPFPGDPVYREYVADILKGAESSGGPSTPLGRTESAEPFTGGPFDELPPFDKPEEVSASSGPRIQQSTEQQAPTLREKIAAALRTRKASSGETSAQIRQEGGRLRYSDTPVTTKWWFWTATGAVAAGTVTAVLVVAKGKSDPDSTDTPGVFTVTVETSN